MTTFLNWFLDGFTKKQIKDMIALGSPLQALYMQDIMLGAQYEGAVANFMRMKGVKNVSVRTFDD